MRIWYVKWNETESIFLSEEDALVAIDLAKRVCGRYGLRCSVEFELSSIW